MGLPPPEDSSALLGSPLRRQRALLGGRELSSALLLGGRELYSAAENSPRLFSAAENSPRPPRGVLCLRMIKGKCG
jgi:hypothetical protein